MWLCALAYWQLLLMRDEVNASQPAWYPAGMKAETKGLTPGQIQRSALGYLVQFGTPAQDTRKAGKGIGRSKGYRPAARKCYPVVKKAKNLQNRASAATLTPILATIQFLRFERFYGAIFTFLKSRYRYCDCQN